MQRSLFHTIRSSRAGFTLLEVLFASSMIGVAASTALWALLMMNKEAAVARNYTGAATVVQNQIDLILSDGPFNPQKTNADGSPQIPPELQLGTQTQNNVAIYQDPVSGIVVPGTMTTIVTDASFAVGTVTIPAYRATVTVTYTFRSRSYSFAMNTIRVSDI